MIILITGGIKSGKSSFALSLAEKSRHDKENLYYLATALPMDNEMAERIEKHKASRKECWNTIEEQEDLASATECVPDGSILLIDCLTLWLSNLLDKMGVDALTFVEVKKDIEKIISMAKGKQLKVIFITNEVGSGIISENKLVRIYGDILGKVNQLIAGYADEVYLMAAGISIKIKEEKR